MTDLIGYTIGQYQIVERIGKGGMATVYKAYQPALERYVAIKVIHEQLVADDETFLKRFRREAKTVAALRHPNIVQVFDFGIRDGIWYMVMEYLEGTSLKAKLNALAEKGETMPLEEAQRIFWAVASALEHAHRQGIVHRDIKPANVMLTTKGDVVLTDFGIAKIVGGTQYTVTGAITGTPAYMSPEQGQGERGDERSDIYALGVMLYEMVTGRVPFEADTPLAVLQKHVSAPLPLPRHLNPAIPRAVEQVILKALAKKPKHRYQTVARMAGALKAALAGEGLLVRERLPELAVAPLAPPRRAVPWVPIGLGLVGVGLLAVAIAIVAAGGITPLARRPTPTPALTPTATVLVVLPTATPVPPTAYPTYTPGPTDTPPPPTPTATFTPTRAPLPSPPTATPTAALTGKITFTLWDGVKYNVWVANVDGSEQTVIIWAMRQPAFSPDGSKIAVNGEAHYHDNLHVVNADGSNLIEVSEHLEDSRPSWAPDGSRIVFDSTSHGDKRSRIYILDGVTTRTEGHILRSAGSDTFGRDPCWMPDGHIVYNGCDYWAGAANCGLYIVPPDGSAIPTQLTTDSSDMAPAAHGSKVVFMSIRDGNWEIYSIHTDGSDLKRLTDNGVNDGLLAFSPDGQFIAFVSDEGGKWAIWAMNADGSGRRKLFDLNGGYGSGEGYDWTTERISWAP